MHSACESSIPLCSSAHRPLLHALTPILRTYDAQDGLEMLRLRETDKRMARREDKRAETLNLAPHAAQFRFVSAKEDDPAHARTPIRMHKK